MRHYLQTGPVHACDSDVAPTQLFPVAQVRCRVSVPEPHVTEQDDQGDQLFQRGPKGEEHIDKV